jgi:Protein of unknown function (DUF1573)
MHRGTFSRALAFSILTVGTAVWGAEQPPAPTTPAPAATNVLGPKIQFETIVHDFGRAKSGDQVKYTYIFTNVGDQSLELSGVQACGCITADWTKRVEPGKTGLVPISFNSANYSGPVVKMIAVTCNDRANPRPVLQFKGAIWKPIDVNPPFAVLNLTADAPLASTTVVITNHLPEPITLSAPQCNNPAFSVELKTNQPGKEFRLVIAPVSPLSSGNAQAQITVKTSSTNMPVITITAYANVRPAVTINPPQIVLRAAPLAQPLTNTISFIDNSTNAMALSEPTINATGVDVQLREVQPGRQFSATLTFPQGFEIAPGQKAELSIKSSLPLVPALKVPILQTPRPAPPKVVPIKVSSSTATNRHRVPPPIDLPPLPP